ncbi:MAG: hypothetical protein AAF411_05405 [Myxococcota bacterium]
MGELLDLRGLGTAFLIVAVLPETLFIGARALTSDAGFSLMALCMATALGVVGYAAYREQVVTVRRVNALRDPARRDAMIAHLRRTVLRATQRGDYQTLEEAVREAVEALLLAGCWDEVRWFIERSPRGRPAFYRWLMGVSALAALREGDDEGAKNALDSVHVEGPWLESIDALRLALRGDGDDAMARLGDDPPRTSPAVAHQRWLARVHALAAVGRRHEAAMMLAARTDALTAVLVPEGPASSLALGLMHDQGGPFRAPH